MKIGIIGCGLIGNKRANSVEKSDCISYVMISMKKKQKNYQLIQGKNSCSENQIFNSDVDAVFISTTHDLLAKLSFRL